MPPWTRIFHKPNLVIFDTRSTSPMLGSDYISLLLTDDYNSREKGL